MKSLSIPELNRACTRVYDQLMAEKKANEEAYAASMKAIRRR